MGNGLKVAGVIFLMVSGVVMFGIAGELIHLGTQPLRIVNKTFDADNVIYNYHWFKQQVADIGGITTKAENADQQVKAFEAAAGDRSTWSFEDKQRDQELGSITLGLSNQRADMVAAYNAHAQEADRSIFMQGVPDHID